MKLRALNLLHLVNTHQVLDGNEKGKVEIGQVNPYVCTR